MVPLRRAERSSRSQSTSIETTSSRCVIERAVTLPTHPSPENIRLSLPPHTPRAPGRECRCQLHRNKAGRPNCLPAGAVNPSGKRSQRRRATYPRRADQVRYGYYPYFGSGNGPTQDAGGSRMMWVAGHRPPGCHRERQGPHRHEANGYSAFRVYPGASDQPGWHITPEGCFERSSALQRTASTLCFYPEHTFRRRP